LFSITIFHLEPKRQEQPMSPRNDDDDADRQNTYDEPPNESAYRSSSPPVPTIKNKDKKQKPNNNHVRRQSFDDTNQHQPLPFNDNDELTQPPIDDNDGQSRQMHRKPPTPRQTGLTNNLKRLSIAISCCFCLYRFTTSTEKSTT
jgi:hypothetical protein